MDKIKITISLIITLLIGAQSFAQHSVGGGLTVFNNLNFQKQWKTGLHLYAELPRTETNTFYVKGTVFFPSTDITYGPETYNPNTDMFDKEEIKLKSGIFSVDGGTRYYFLGTYDTDKSIYAGTSIRGTFNTLKLSSSSNPEVQRANTLIGSAYGYIGFKYQLPYRSAIYVDLGGDIKLLSLPGGQFSTLDAFFFTMNVGYRFDWF